MSTNTPLGRKPKDKGVPYLLKLDRRLDGFVRKECKKKPKKSYLRVIEELIEFRMLFKQWPPK